MTNGDDNADEPLGQTMASSSEPASFGSGRYVVKQILGEGAQKTVYLVHDTSLGRDCALSLLKTENLEGDDLVRMRREAQTVARLTHGNIITVHDISAEAEPQAFIVSEYVSGGDLRAALNAAGGPLATRRAVAISEDLCSALSVAHRNEVVHRDLKPENIWLTDDGSAKLGDFGFALDVERTRLTSPGSSAAQTMMRTATYMAPEQAQGRDVTARSDLYSLGCVLYEMLTGHPPFEGDDPMAVVAQHVAAAPAPLSEHNDAVPEKLEQLVLRMLEKDPDNRPASADDVLAELETIEAMPLSDPAHPGIAWRGLLGRPAVRIAAAALFLAVVGGGVTATVLLRGGSESSAAATIANYIVDWEATSELVSGTDCSTEELTIHNTQIGQVTGDVTGQEVASVDVTVFIGCAEGYHQVTTTSTDLDGNTSTSFGEGPITINGPNSVSETVGTYTGDGGASRGVAGTYACRTTSRESGSIGEPDFRLTGRSVCQSERTND